MAVDAMRLRLVHFGHAEQFAVYEVSSHGCEEMAVRGASAFCQRDEKQSKLESTADLLADCDALLCQAIGPCAQHELADAQVTVYEFDGSVQDALFTVAHHPLFQSHEEESTGEELAS